MDTRTKIIPFEQAVNLARTARVSWVTGHFDPLLAEHGRQLRQCAAPDHLLIVVITNPESPLLSQRARAELVAALSIVDHVVIKDGAAPSTDPEETRITREFIEHVLCRSRAS